MTQTRTLLVLLLMLASSAAARAGAGNRSGTNGAAELLIPVGARDIAMGGASIATAQGVEALYWNPAGVTRMRGGAAVYLSHMNYIADIGVNYGAVSANVEGFGILSLSLKSLSVGEIPVTTTLDPDGTGQNFSPQFLTLGLTYSRQLNDRISVGFTSHLISERMGEVSANGVAFDVGVLYDNLGGLDGLGLGVVVKNIGPQMKFDGSGLLTTASVSSQNRPPQLYEIQAASFELPSTIEFGLGYHRAFGGVNSILVSTVFQSNNFSDDEYRFGLEYGYQDILFLRGGYNVAQRETDERQFIFGPTVGMGIQYPLGSIDVSFDYAYRSTKIFDGNHIFSVRLGF